LISTIHPKSILFQSNTSNEEEEDEESEIERTKYDLEPLPLFLHSRNCQDEFLEILRFFFFDLIFDLLNVGCVFLFLVIGFMLKEKD